MQWSKTCIEELRGMEGVQEGETEIRQSRSKDRIKLERGPLGMYVAPTQALTSSVILQEVVVAGVTVIALIDSGAITLCCSRRLYRRYHVEVGLLIQDQTQIIGVENTPIFVHGRTVRLPLEWKEAVSTVSFLVDLLWSNKMSSWEWICHKDWG